MDTTLSFSSEAHRRAPADPFDSPVGHAPHGKDAPDPLDALALRFADIDLTPKQLGALGERYAAAWLERRGCTVLDRNWRSRYGELDIIAATPDRTVLFVEVKTRRNARYGTPQEAVTAHKRLALRRAGVQWLLCPEHRMAHRGIRFDVIAITAPMGASPTVNHIREAF